MSVPTFFIIPHTIPPTRVQLHVTHTKTNPKKLKENWHCQCRYDIKIANIFCYKKYLILNRQFLNFWYIFPRLNMLHTSWNVNAVLENLKPAHPLYPFPPILTLFNNKTYISLYKIIFIFLQNFNLLRIIIIWEKNEI